jgi:hypothetical protein
MLRLEKVDLDVFEIEDQSLALQASASRRAPPEPTTPPSAQPIPPQPSSIEIAKSVTALFASSSKYVAAVRKPQWREVRKTFHLINKKGNLLVLFAMGSVGANYLRDQGNYGQYNLRVALNEECRAGLEAVIAACPEKGQVSPLNGCDLKMGMKFDKVFGNSDNKTKDKGKDKDTPTKDGGTPAKDKKGTPTPFPNISDARELDDATPLDSLSPFPAADLGEGSVVVVAFTLATYTFGNGGISAKLEHVYVIDPVREQSLLETPVKPKVISLDSEDEDEDSE